METFFKNKLLINNKIIFFYNDELKAMSLTNNEIFLSAATLEYIEQLKDEIISCEKYVNQYVACANYRDQLKRDITSLSQKLNEMRTQLLLQEDCDQKQILSDEIIEIETLCQQKQDCLYYYINGLNIDELNSVFARQKQLEEELHRLTNNLLHKDEDLENSQIFRF